MPKSNFFSNLIFDFGGVLLNIDTDLAVKGFENIGLEDSSVIGREFGQHGIFNRLEKGKISPEEFRRDIRKYLKADVTDWEIDQAWNAMLLDLPHERIALLNRLKENHRLFLLSNTNEIHWQAYTSAIKREHGVWLPDMFEEDFYSHRMGLRKPDPQIFLEVLNKRGLKAEETLFIDDSLENVNAARQLGMGGHFLDLKKGETILDLF